MLVRIPTFD